MFPILLRTIGVAATLAVLPLGAAETKKILDLNRLPPPASGSVDFAREIQPLLAQHCQQCHGAERQKGGLRLDVRQGALEGGDSGAVIIPGRGAESRLLHLVAKLDGETQMPPPGENRSPLTREQVAKIRAWIDAGAIWPESAAATVKKSAHWAFNAPRRPVPPEVPGAASRVRNPIDTFVLARLERERLTPSPEASRHTLIRRLSLDLLGLPPTAAEVREFVNDTRPDAYEQLVDRLLRSPHFGERWGRHWLDLARYADSDGYEKDRTRPFAYVYRDWVIQAINDDVPFDRFSILQLAGDLLPGAKITEQTATGFHRQTLTNTEGGTDQEEFRCKATVDRVSTTAAVWLGVTMGCAECHTHKYDPFTQREFYQLFAFFNNASEKNLPAPQPEELRAWETARKKWADEQARLAQQRDALATGPASARFTAWATKAAASSTPWLSLTPLKTTAAAGTTLKAEKDGAIVASGTLPAKETYTVETQPGASVITGFRLEALPDPTVKKGNVGRAKDGNFVLTRFAVRLLAAGKEPVNLPLQNTQADFSQPRFHVSAALKGESASGWAVAKQTDQPHTAVFELKEPLTVPPGARLEFTLDQQYGENFTLGRFRLSATTAQPPLKLDSLPDAVALALSQPAETRDARATESLKKYFASQVDPEGRKLQKAIDDHAAKAPKAPDTFAATLAEEPAGRVTKVHIRGNFLDRGAEVRPGTPAVLHGFKARAQRPDRLDLANWLFDPANPLTARVTVNHWWKNLFGRGLVTSVDDFGVKGEPPSHPELLDWLATELPRLGWSRKAMLKLIVTSATYRQQSHLRPELVTRDPNNILLARQNRIRLEAESVRDAYLAASGLLNTKLGGPSIRPPLPADIAALGYANSVKWTESPGAEKNRRGLYIFFQRTVPYPMLMTFDAPDSNATCTRRERSNTPLQALTLLNDPVFFECAQALGKRIAETPSASPADRLRAAFEMCLSRPPTDDEMKVLRQVYDTQLKLAQANPANAAKIFDGKPDDPRGAEKATLVALSRVLLNLDEFVTRD